MLKYLGVSRSGYNTWSKHLPSNQQKRKDAIKDRIQKIYDDSKQNYGAPKSQRNSKTLVKNLQSDRRQVYERNWDKGSMVKPYTITTKDSDFSNKLQNILDENFNPERPNAVWCGHNLYLDNRWICIFDKYYGSVFQEDNCLTLSKSLEVSCIIETINKAKSRRKVDLPLILHSDRGS